MNLLQLIKLLFGPRALSKTLGTRTNVIRLPDKKMKRYIKEDLNIEAASDELAQKAYKDMEQLVPEIPRMNDAEKLIFEGNLRRLKNKLKIKDPSDPTAEVIEFGTKQKVSPKGIETLTEQAGQKSPPGTFMGNLESRLNKLKASGKELEDIAKEKGGIKFSIPEEGIFNQEMSADNLFDTIVKQQDAFRKLQNRGLVTSTTREILQRDIKAGKLKLPKEIEDRIMLVDGNPGTVDPVEIFRTNYGEDALEQVDSLIPELARAQSYSDLVKIVEKKYPMKPLAKPRKEAMTMDEAAKAEQENILTPKKPEEPEEFATGGRVNRVGFKFGTKFGRFWKIARKVWDDINPTGDRKYDAQLVADELAEKIFKTSMDDLPQKVQIDLYALAYNNAPKVDSLFTNPKNLSEAAKKGMAASKEMKSLGLDVSKQSDFFKYENMKLSGELGPEHQVQAYKDKIRDEFSGVIDDTLMKQVEVDDNPQRLAEVYASIKEGLTMQKRGMSPEEIIRVMKQTPRTKNADGGSMSQGLDYLMGIERRGYADGTESLKNIMGGDYEYISPTGKNYNYDFIRSLPGTPETAAQKFGREAVYGKWEGASGEDPGTYVPGKYTSYYDLIGVGGEDESAALKNEYSFIQDYILKPEKLVSNYGLEGAKKILAPYIRQTTPAPAPAPAPAPVAIPVTEISTTPSTPVENYITDIVGTGAKEDPILDKYSLFVKNYQPSAIPISNYQTFVNETGPLKQHIETAFSGLSPFFKEQYQTFATADPEKALEAALQDLKFLTATGNRPSYLQDGGRVGYEAGGVSINPASLPDTATAAINQYGQDMFNALNLQQYYYPIGATGDADQGGRRPPAIATVETPKLGVEPPPAPEPVAIPVTESSTTPITSTPVENYITDIVGTGAKEDPILDKYSIFVKNYQPSAIPISNYQTFVDETGPLKQHIETAFSSLSPFFKEQYQTFATAAPEKALEAALQDLKFLTATGNKPSYLQNGGRVGYSEGTIDPAKVKQIKQMLKMGADESTISSITGATPEQIQSIQQQKENKATGGRVGYAEGGLNYLLGI